VVLAFVLQRERETEDSVNVITEQLLAVGIGDNRRDVDVDE
jgi:hypothetical protein